MALLGVLLGRKMPREDNRRAIGKPIPEPRRRYLNASELGAILRGLDAEPHLWRVFWLCAILVPLRRGNIAGARWADVHLDGSPHWEVSATNAKGRKLLTPPIPEALAPILRDWQAKNPGQEYVFPAGLTGSPVRAGYKGPVVNVQHAWTRAVQFGEAVRICDAIAQAEGKTGRERFAIFLRDLEAIRFESWRIARERRTMERDGTPLTRALVQLRTQAKALGIDPAPLAIKDVCPHDLRRTAASWAVQAGASLSVVAASLGHADTRITEQHYGHLSDDPVCKMQNENAGRVLASMGQKLDPQN